MGAFSEDGAALEWRGGHETVRIEPWGPDSLRVRGTLWQSVRTTCPGRCSRRRHLPARGPNSPPTRPGSPTAG